MKKYLVGVALLATLLSGCAVPPDTSQLTDECKEAAGISDELKSQAGKLFKNYDHAKELIAKVKDGCSNFGKVQVGRGTESPAVGTFNVGTICIEGYKFAWSGTGGLAAFVDDYGHGITCK